ncbi:MAG: lysoplasmalogenase [Acidobacteriota bacterium]|nr:lysoplasmalogenase [Acidobacteriota bacterium]
MQYLYLCPICLAIAAVFILVEKMKRYVVADTIKGVASAFFVVLGVLGATRANDATFARMVVVGLVLGALADVLLNLRYVYEGRRGQIAFLAGTLVFLAGHVCYIIACVPHCNLLPLAAVVAVPLTAALMWWILGQIEAGPVLKICGVLYIGAVVLLNCVALATLATSPNAHWLMFLVGAMLFLVSDVILILNNFGSKPRFLMRVANLMLYYAGQLLIALCLQLPL